MKTESRLKTTGIGCSRFAFIRERQESNMAKTYVLDTNVLIQSPQALISFEENDLVLPWWSWRNWMA